MAKPLALMGVPSSAAAFAPGQEKAPRALRDAGLVERLNGAGIETVDYGDRPVWRWRPDRRKKSVLNLDVVVDIARDTASRVRSAAAKGQMALVMGGDCTVGLGTIAGCVSEPGKVGLIYFDLHTDLNVPGSVQAPALDWMGMAHALGEDKAADELVRFGPRAPLLEPADVLFFAYGPDNRTGWEREVWDRLGLDGIPVDEVSAAPEAAAGAALARLGPDVDCVLVHFDVDTVDFLDAPLSENTGYNEGLSFEQAMRAFGALVSSERLGAVTITELNPDHGAEDGSTLDGFVAALTEALASSPVLQTRKARSSHY